MLATAPNPTHALTRGRWRPADCLADIPMFVPGGDPNTCFDWTLQGNAMSFVNTTTLDAGVRFFNSAGNGYGVTPDIAVGDAFTVVLFDFKTLLPGGTTAPVIWSLATEPPGTNADGLCFFWLGGNVGYYVGDETKNSAVAAADFNAGFRSFAWTVYYVAGSIMQEFADGVPQTPRSPSADHCAVTQPLRIAYPHTLFGSFNEQAHVYCSRAQVYDRRLTDREILALHRQGGR